MYKTISLFGLVLLLGYIVACSDENDNNTSTGQDKKLVKINKSIAADTSNASHYFRRANYYYYNKAYNLALQDVKRAIKKDSTTVKYWHTYADILMDKLESRKAIAVMDTAAARFENSEETKIKLARMNFILKQYLPALKNLNQVIRNNPQNPRAFYVKARIYDELRDTTNAMKNYQRATELNADLRGAWIAMGDILSAQGKDIALQMYDNAIDIKPQQEGGYLAIANHYHQNGKLRKAKREYEKIIRRFPQFPPAQYNLGLLYLEQDSIKSAHQRFNSTIQIDPSNGNAYLYRGITFKLLGDTASAKNDFNQAMALLPQNDRRAAIELKSIE